MVMNSNRSLRLVKFLALALLTACFGGSLANAQVAGGKKPVKMTFSGNGAASPINIKQPNTNTAEENVAGNGTLGRFTFRNVTAIATSPSPQPPSTCSGPIRFTFLEW